MKWIHTTDGAVNAAFVVRLIREGDGTILHLKDGSTVRSSAMFRVVEGELVVVEPLDDDGDIVF